ncbi:MAG: penicillin-binding protein activator LpoB [Sulfurospirillum sp.]|nr:penicillin-binding protein activator LpoB [Sulfurospirillum sp.]MBL0703277.1 penicillin-binding protein activator LpoB [Sulfurospirillum sp.]
MKIVLVSLIAIGALVFTGCTSKPHYVGVKNSKDMPTTMSIDRRDFEKAANEAIKDLLDSGALDRQDGEKYVVAMGRMVNDTTQKIDTDMLIKKIRIAMLKSGKAVVTTAVKAGGAEDEMTHEVRKLRENSEFKQSTIAKKGTIYAPDMSLSGKIMQRIIKAGKKDQLVEYYFHLTLTQIETGLAIWEGESIVGKVGSNDSVIW